MVSLQNLDFIGGTRNPILLVNCNGLADYSWAVP
jgi:hypothetical protein